MKTEHLDAETKGLFRMVDGSNEVGIMTYSKAGKERLIIDHTDVNAEYNGKNIGRKLLMEVVNFARKNKLKIIPLCPFAKSVFDKDEKIRDVL